MIEKQINEAITLAEEHNIEVPLNEALTYYQLRLFLSVMLKQVGSSETKSMLVDLIKTLAKMEIRSVPVPTLKKMTNKEIDFLN
jgi:hypothetical protein